MQRTLARWLTVIILSLTSLAGGLMMVSTAAAATVVYVAPTGSGGGSCATPDYNVIQDAVNAATAGETIHVCAGTYTETVVISTALTLEGAQAGVDVADRTAGDANEATINGSGGSTIEIDADNVTVDGFTISNTNGMSGIFDHESSNVTIVNNFVNNVTSTGTTPIFGIYAESVSTSLTNILIQANSISNVHQTGGHGSAMGIYIGDSNGTTTIDGLVIDSNTISDVTADTTTFPTGHGAYGILLNHGTSGGSTTNAQITANTISGLEGLWAHGIGLEGDTPNAVVERNSISQLTDHKSPTDAAAVNIEDNDSATSITLHFNNFTSVNIGVQNTTENPVDAKYNYWGCWAGPGAAGCATTSGPVVGQPSLPIPYITVTQSSFAHLIQLVRNFLSSIFGAFLPPA